MALHVAGKEAGEGNQEAAKEDDHGPGAPFLAVVGNQRNPAGVSAVAGWPGDFFGDAGVPEKHVLAEGDVAPEEGEREEELAEIMIVFNGDGLAKEADALQQGDDDDRAGEETDHAAGEIVDAEHRAVPMRVEGHEEVPRGEREREAEENEADAAVLLHGGGVSVIAVGVLEGGLLEVIKGDG